MLILTRYPGQKIMIGDDIVVTVLNNQFGQVKIGVDAPRNMRVDREEIRDRINKEGNK